MRNHKQRTRRLWTIAAAELVLVAVLSLAVCRVCGVSVSVWPDSPKAKVKRAMSKVYGSNQWKIHEMTVEPDEDEPNITVVHVRWEVRGPGGYWQQNEDWFRVARKE